MPTDNNDLLLATAQTLRALLFMMTHGGLEPLSPDTVNNLVNLMARLDGALGANETVGK